MKRVPWLTVEEAKQAIAQGDGAGVQVAIIDSGVEVDHPDLSGLILAHDIHVVDNGLQVETRPGDGSDIYGHGTAVAGIIRKAAPKAELGSFRVLGERLASRTVVIREGVRQAIDAGYKILNCSFGCGLKDHVLQYKDWIDEAYLKGIHIVAACNNNDFDTPEWPGFFPSVISVNMAKTTSESEFYYYPGHMVQLAAGGVNIKTAWRRREVREVTGSSFAAPRVAALLARLLSVFPSLHPLEAKALLLELAEEWRPELRPSNVAYAT